MNTLPKPPANTSLGNSHDLRPAPMSVRLNALARYSLWLGLAATACGGGDSTGNNNPTGVSIVSGDGQVAAVGNVLPAQVVFKVAGPKGGVAGVSISAAVPAGQGGSP